MANITEVDFTDEQQCKAVVDLMNHYMQDKMGDHPPHDDASAKRLIEGLKKHCNKLCLLAELNGKFVGLTNCFIGFGTFAAKPVINIHDIVVLKDYRDAGIGRQLLEAVSEKAIEMDCAKITLEVREDNIRAKYLYNKLGFQEGKPTMHFWTKYLEA
jgi:ribosomal protein S18 acetylase RimI-like enzyme